MNVALGDHQENYIYMDAICCTNLKVLKVPSHLAIYRLIICCDIKGVVRR